MQIPLNIWNVSLWLAVTGIILLITVQLIQAYDGKASFLIDQRRLKHAALFVGILFLLIVSIHLYG